VPEVDGVSVLRALRRQSRTPVIILSARGTVGDRIGGLEVGADDYLPKPFSPAELVLRVQRILERVGEGDARQGQRSAQIHHADLVVDPDRHEVTVGGRLVPLTAAEFRLLTSLLEAGGRVLTRDQLMDSMYGIDEVVLDRTIDVHIGRQREKLGEPTKQAPYVTQVRGAR